MKHLNEYILQKRPEIISQIENFLSEKKAEDLKIPLYKDALKRLSEFAVSGKTLRGILVIAASEMFGGDGAGLVKLAAAVELVHSGLLIHDDIIDDDRIRRGKKTIFAQYEERENSKFYGQSMAICVADSAFFISMELASSAQIDAEVKNNILKIFAAELQKVIASEMQDFHFGATDYEPEITEIINMYRLKSARYTFSLPLTLGAMASGQNEIIIKQLEDFGENLGIVFQIVDDALGITGDEKVTGKPVGNDIKQNKKTVFRRLLFDAAGPQQKELLNSIFGKQDINADDVQKVISLARDLNVNEKIEKIVNDYSDSASKILEKLEIPKDFKILLTELIEYNLSRTK